MDRTTKYPVSKEPYSIKESCGVCSCDVWVRKSYWKKRREWGQRTFYCPKHRNHKFGFMLKVWKESNQERREKDDK